MTLVEIMITTSVIGLFTTGVTSFFLFSLTTMFISEQRLKINDDIRQLTAEMTNFARESNNFVVYPSFTATDRDAETDRVRHGLSGDFVVLVYFGPYNTTLQRQPIDRIVGYYRSPVNPSDPSSTGPVRRFEYDPLDDTTRYKTVEQLLAENIGSSASHREIIQLSRGLANGKLFYNNRDRSVIVNGQIYHGNDAKRVTDTYNFTISPRS